MSAKEAMRRFKFCLDFQEVVFHGKPNDFFALDFFSCLGDALIKRTCSASEKEIKL